jgi:hypothetical protein
VGTSHDSRRVEKTSEGGKESLCVVVAMTLRFRRRRRIMMMRLTWILG